MSLRDDSALKLRKLKGKWRHLPLEEIEEKEKEFLKEKLYSKEPTIRAQVRVTAGSAKNILLDVPKNTRPLTDRIKVSVFDTLGPELVGKTVLDLFAGSGSFGIEAMSRGASSATFVDASKHAERLITGNLERTGFSSKSTVIKQKAEEFLYQEVKGDTTYDIIYFDPPFKIFNTKKTKAVTEMLNLAGRLLPGNRGEEGFPGIIMIRHPKRYPIQSLKLEGIKIAEIFHFGISNVSLIIVDNISVKG